VVAREVRTSADQEKVVRKNVAVDAIVEIVEPGAVTRKGLAAIGANVFGACARRGGRPMRDRAATGVRDFDARARKAVDQADQAETGGNDLDGIAVRAMTAVDAAEKAIVEQARKMPKQSSNHPDLATLDFPRKAPKY
jgi:hypothetical protein